MFEFKSIPQKLQCLPMRQSLEPASQRGTSTMDSLSPELGVCHRLCRFWKIDANFFELNATAERFLCLRLIKRLKRTGTEREPVQP